MNGFFPFRLAYRLMGQVSSHFATAVCVCSVSPLGHSIAPVILQVRNPGRFHVDASPGSAVEQHGDAVGRLAAMPECTCS